MWEWFAGLDPVPQALLAGGVTWLVTALGAATVFLRRQLPQALLDAMLGFAAGIMIAASFWSLLAPAIDLAEFDRAEGVPTHLRHTTLLVLAITLHNIPEGLAVGVAFGGASGADAVHGVSLAAAVALALGIAIQNLPEGMAVAMPLRREGYSRLRAFGSGQLSAAVEPVAAVLGAASVTLISPILPAAQRSGRTDLVTSATMIGFAVMMALDVALGS